MLALWVCQRLQAVILGVACLLGEPRELRSLALWGWCVLTWGMVRHDLGHGASCFGMRLASTVMVQSLHSPAVV